ncbi:MAG: phr [Rhodospirillaceae bacterium]|nr:MAG: phr [Rhodospirillaceae bacterium]
MRNDLRITDNPALAEASATKSPVVPLYVLEKSTDQGTAGQWWLHGSLAALGRSFARLGAPLIVRRGRAEDVLPAVAEETGAAAVHWNRCYDAGGMARDQTIAERLQRSGIAVRQFKAVLLFDPGAILSPDGTPYRRFSAFWNQAATMALETPLPAPPVLCTPAQRIWSEECTAPATDHMGGVWAVGEDAARKRLARFISTGLAGYAAGRNGPTRTNTSRLSVHLRFGEISPR